MVRHNRQPSGHRTTKRTLPRGVDAPACPPWQLRFRSRPALPASNDYGHIYGKDNRIVNHIGGAVVPLIRGLKYVAFSQQMGSDLDPILGLKRGDAA